MTRPQHKPSRSPLLLLPLLAAAFLLPIGAGAQDDPTPVQVEIRDPARAITPDADRILRNMSDFLAATESFSFHADVTYDSVSREQQKIQLSGAADISVQRPSRVRSDYEGDNRHSTAILNDGTFSVLDARANVYATTQVPPVIDDAIDYIFEQLGHSVPIADILYADPYDVMTEFVDTGKLIGTHTVHGTPCHHLAFTQQFVDWQIWIEKGDRPLPRKMVISYKSEPQSPQYMATLSNWKTHPRFHRAHFRFIPPDDADQIDFLTELDQIEEEERDR